jgi:DNA-binding NtrC family response regulator
MFMKLNLEKNNRILLIAHNHAVHEEIRRILTAPSDVADSLGEEEVSSLEGKRKISDVPIFKVDSAYQGQEGLALIEKGLRENEPYALAFVEMHMSLDWEGIEATCEIWKRYPELQVIIITAYECSWEEMLKRLGYSERMVILKKPFDGIEVLQMAVAMTKRWQSGLRAKLRLENLEKLANEGALLLQSADKNFTKIAAQLLKATKTAKTEATAVALSGKSEEVQS